jgi:hypothetical protein
MLNLKMAGMFPFPVIFIRPDAWPITALTNYRGFAVREFQSFAFLHELFWLERSREHSFDASQFPHFHVIYQRQHARLPLEQLKAVPQPVWAAI